MYLDYNGTTPVDPRVVEAMTPYLGEHFGNPSSAHGYGERPQEALERARDRVASLIGAGAGQIVFTGSGSEADALAILGVLAVQGRGGRPHLITQVTEHPAVAAACELARTLHDADVTALGVDREGRVDPRELERALRPETVLVSIMHANNETGTLQPIGELARITRAHGALFHTDAAQSVGKVSVDVADLGVDLLTLVGHKLYAPKGIAALYVRDRAMIEPIIGGGGQERGLRAGTENVPYIVGLGTAADLAAADLVAGVDERLRSLRDLLSTELDRRLPGRVHLNGSARERLPQTLNVSIDGTVGHELLAACPGIAASTGSACHAGVRSSSPVLAAMGVKPEHGQGALRLSLGRWTTEDDVLFAAGTIAAAA
ncbi:cysteine desulfurase family protein [Nocardiopsis dassonvillei]|uniref:cysteine desulfurase family protein n=1 Tax=Nocardiopsis dassonvillei TaxID=2014 RepID=UPI003F565566